jgi:hypothetical protein
MNAMPNASAHIALLAQRATQQKAAATQEVSLELFAQGDLLPPQAQTAPTTLPDWSDAIRGVPNAILRGALFAAIQGKDRKYLKQAVIEHSDGMTIRFTGQQLDQSDLDVWETLVHISRNTPKGERFFFQSAHVLRYLGRPQGGDHFKWLQSAMDRMVACSITVTFGDRYTYSSNMLKLWRDEITGEQAVILDEQLLSLYSYGWTQINWAQRDALRGKPLALWLHGWYCSHASPEDLTVERIHQLCGSTNPTTYSFKAKLKVALGELKKIGAISNFAVSRNGLVTVERKPLNVLPGFV